MKRCRSFKPILFLLCLVFTSSWSLTQAQAKWSEWSSAPCHQGISVSTVNMGHSKSAGGYLWGIRMRNDYSKPITFRYRLSIGEKNTSQEGGDAVWKLKPGEIWTDGNDKFTAKLFQSSSFEYHYYIWNVCFDGAICGGPSNCYAQCDATKGKENQPCGVEPPPAATKPNPPVTGNTNNTNNPTATKGKPATTAGKTKTTTEKTVSPAAFNRAEVEKEAKKIVDLQCKVAELFGKVMELEEAGKPSEKLNNELNKFCCEKVKLIDLFYKKYEKDKKAQELFDKIWSVGYNKCPYTEGCDECL